ncbi:hypothetical protein [Streptococcus dysgalactiae]|uniref:Uncharacterized protein n=1 Tax=Streptococcus dysgalactiae subsp. equisimilis TaxID=119602 RepID=A0A9X8SYQ3_STREQ|nr:hypothetical protein [Streptococcus dysgalactiae]MDO5365603.1 hypothetical protein [Streptococcus dysgalactiae]SQF66636.1 Uncharacterised protein [Streptococcus dysgalactiae subsp. equisimilis]VEF08336.1 Uncharacterised protein [Streptococcus dysgalactiae subsp. equisimilis]
MTITIISKLSFLNSLEDKVIFINKNYLTTVPNHSSITLSLPKKTNGSETYSLSCNRLGLPAIKVEDGDTIFIVNNPYFKIAIIVVLLCFFVVIFLTFSKTQLPPLYQKYALLLNACFIGIPNLIPRYRLIKDAPNLHS